MVIKKIHFSIVILLILISSCISKECKDTPDLEFELLVNYSAVKDTFNIGDTLSIWSEFSDILTDPGLNVSEKVENFSFFTTIIFKLILDEEFIPISIDSGQIINPDVDYLLIDYSDESFGIYIKTHNYEDEKYRFEFQLVLQNKGLYSISTISDLGISTNTSQQKFEGQCANQDLTAVYKVNNGNAHENNFALLKNSTLYEGSNELNFNRNGGFSFYVKEE